MTRATLSLKKKTVVVEPVEPAIKKAETATSDSKPAKPVLGRKKRNQKVRDRILTNLIKHWPNIFSLSQPKPLKVGIYEDVFVAKDEKGFNASPNLLRGVFTEYCNTNQYHEAMLTFGSRFDLEGNESTLEPENKEHSRQILIERKLAGKYSDPLNLLPEIATPSC